MSIWRRSSSAHGSQTSYWPLCSGGRLSQEAMWQLQGITVNLKKKKGFVPEELTSGHDCSRIPHQSLSKGELHYIPHTAVKPSRLDATTRDGNPSWTETDMNVLTHCWWFLGTNRTRMGLLSLSFCVDMCNLFYACFHFLFFFLFLKLLSEKSDISAFFSGKRKRIVPCWHM